MISKNKKNIWGFTLIELVVSMTILVILTGVWFYSYVQNVVDARDSVRISDTANIWAQLKIYKRNRWAYPTPGSNFSLQSGSKVLATQWLLNEEVPLSNLDEIPLDPKIEIPYTYSVTRNKQEFEIALTLEWENWEQAVLEWDYSSVSKNRLPTITIAHTWPSIDVITNNNLFIFNQWFDNAPYTFESPYDPKITTKTLTELMNDSNIKYWQNSDFRSCTEIEDAGKTISDAWDSEEYQILDSSGVLTSVICDFL